MKSANIPNQKIHGSKLKSTLINDYQLYIMLIPGLLLLIIFRYIPITGLVIAFKDYNVYTGIWESKWVGLKHFSALFNTPDFGRILMNTIIISFYKIIFGFPAPIILAIFLNEIKSLHFKRVAQNIFYLPHFLSWVIISGLAFDVFSKSGIINQIIKFIGMEPIFFLGDPRYFRSVLVVSDMWKETGWGTIIYLAALTSIDPNIYEAAKIDGAGKLRQIIHITIPGITPTIIVLFIIRISKIMDAGQDQILMMYNPMVMKVSDIIDTYVYRVGLGQGKYSFTSAVGMFKSVIAFVMVFSANRFIKRVGGEGLW